METSISALVGLQSTHNVHIHLSTNEIEGLRVVDLSINNKTWSVLVHDEYNDLEESNQLMCFYLVLRSLEIYQSASDFLKWCGINGCKASNLELLAHYKKMGQTVIDIESIIGIIDSKISGLDYELRTEVIEILLARG